MALAFGVFGCAATSADGTCAFGGMPGDRVILPKGGNFTDPLWRQAD